MALEKTQKRAIFQDGETAQEIVFGILKDNGLEENLVIYSEKLIKGQVPYTPTVIRLAKDLALKKIPDNEAVSMLEKNLAVANKVALKMVEEIKGKLVPLVQEITIEETILPEEDFIEKAIKEAENEPMATDNELADEISESKKITPPEKEKIFPPKLNPDIPKPTPKSQDAYREPL